MVRRPDRFPTDSAVAGTLQPMAVEEQISAYLAVAKDLNDKRLSEEDLPANLCPLPPLTVDSLQQLAGKTAEHARDQPRLAWALAAVVDAAATQQGDSLLQAHAAFNLARAANAWVQPQRVQEAASRAGQLFVQGNEPGWVAACDWQKCAVPWMRNDFRDALAVLERCLAVLRRPEVSHLQYDCRLSLAYAHILRTNYEQALDHLDVCEKYFRQAGDVGGLVQTLTFKAAGRRRQSAFEEAIAHVSEALQLVERVQRPLDLARAHFQLGHILTEQAVDYKRAETLLKKALATFTAADVMLWAAQCQNSLSRAYRETGRLAEAGIALQRARETYSRFPVYGLRADALVDSAVFALQKGEASAAIEYLGEAEALYRQLEVAFMVAACQVYRGEAYTELGRYQQALHHLEQAYEQLKGFNRPDRLAEAALRLGETWLWLDRPQQALDYLQEATAHYELTGHTSYLAELYSLLTAARLRNGDDVSQIINSAIAKLSQLEPHGARPALALLQRFTGEAMLACDEPQKALAYLQAATNSFSQMSMGIEVAECYIPTGRCYMALSQPQEARQVWQRALALSEGVLPEIGWRAHDGLAQLARDAGNLGQALLHYEQMVAAFSRLRRWFWQPSLVGAFLHRSGKALDRAVTLAAAQDAVITLRFVEESKAQTVNQHLQPGERLQPATTQASRQQLELVHEIRWLQEEIVSARHSGTPAAIWTRRQSELVEKMKHYETVAGRDERLGREAGPDTVLTNEFNSAAFQRAAGQVLGDRWMALDYYLTGQMLVCVAVKPSGVEILYKTVPLHVQQIINLYTRSRPGADAVPGERLAALARWLLPWKLLETITPGATLIISPHRQLHRLPWAALPDDQGRPLATRCVPLLTHSLHSVTLLQQRDRRDARRLRSPRDGCVIAVSDFGQRYPSLPEVQQEAATFTRQMNGHGRRLFGPKATWDNLLQLSQESGLADFAFLHIASHAFYDAVTGRTSGLALHDRDIWLDELWELAPLPRLVSLSACSGMQSYLYEGDEPISLAATCLKAGAQHVAGSLWPVRDEDASAITQTFYQQVFAGARPAQALAHAQRQAIAAGAPWRSWAPFVCLGAP